MIDYGPSDRTSPTPFPKREGEKEKKSLVLSLSLWEGGFGSQVPSRSPRRGNSRSRCYRSYDILDRVEPAAFHPTDRSPPTGP